MYRIDDSLKEFLESGVAVMLGTGSTDGRPHLAFGWGPRVRDDRTSMDLFVDTARAGRPLANLAENERIAVIFAHPVSYRSVQLKGSFRDSGEPSENDLERVRRHRDDFLVTTTLIGDPAATIQNLWLDDVVRISFDVGGAFDQTPGPEAGKPL
jgi:hypothetical protein